MRADVLIHEGVSKRDGAEIGSGRFPLGSGENPYQHQEETLSMRVSKLKKQGLSEHDIAEGYGLTIRQLRDRISIENSYKQIRQYEQANYLVNELGMSKVDAAKKMGIADTTLGNILRKGEGAAKKKAGTNKVVADELKKVVDENNYIDIGAGTEYAFGITSTKLGTIVQALKDEGYAVVPYSFEQLGTGHKTKMNLLCPPGTKWKDVANNVDRIHAIDERIVDEDGKLGRLGLMNTEGVSSKRVMVRYAEDHGTDKDGVIELRRGVDDISLGNARYAQVRIAVDGTHFLKGMAVYSDDMPKGVDIIFNTNKTKDVPMMGPKNNTVLKPMKDNPDNPFGASIKDEEDLTITQRYYTDKDGNRKLSAINIVNEEGSWNKWSKTLSSQFLSKQNLPLIKKQLAISEAEKRDEFEEIKALTNPEVKKKLLMDFADNCDSAAVHLKAAALPRQSNKVLLPATSLGKNEVYAPTYRPGEEVALVRHPHGGVFEIPILKVTTKNKEGHDLIGDAPDAICINHATAQQLSGADYDGDTALVLPLGRNKIKAMKAIKDLQDFDNKKYTLPDNVDGMSDNLKQKKMGEVSNLITDMTIQGAPIEHIIRAVKHSMVVIDAPKHHLDWKASYKDEKIDELKKLYQPKDPITGQGGAATLISRAKSPVYVDQRRDYYHIDHETGKKIYEKTGAVKKKYKRHKDKETGEWIYEDTGKRPLKQQKSTRMEETDDAYTLLSNARTKKEIAYADYANQMKALANEARKEWLATPSMQKSASAQKIYANEIKDLESKLAIAVKNAPRERKAQIMANETVRLAKRANRDMDKDDLKKLKNQALAVERTRYGARKQPIKITEREWEAIQAGAFSSNKLKKILDNADSDLVKKYATPKASNKPSAAKIARIKAMYNKPGSGDATGYTMREIADQLGLSLSTVSDVINGKY